MALIETATTMREATGDQHRDRTQTKQDYETPPDFFEAVQQRFGRVFHDLAASAHNTKHSQYFDKSQNSLEQDWHKLSNWKREPRLLWLNPEFKNATPWMRKCKEEAALGARIAVLTLASVGSCWYADHVQYHAMSLGLSPRLQFVGHAAPYPKDLMLSMYGPPGEVPWVPGFSTWRWK